MNKINFCPNNPSFIILSAIIFCNNEIIHASCRLIHSIKFQQQGVFLFTSVASNTPEKYIQVKRRKNRAPHYFEYLVHKLHGSVLLLRITIFFNPHYYLLFEPLDTIINFEKRYILINILTILIPTSAIQ